MGTGTNDESRASHGQAGLLGIDGATASMIVEDDVAAIIAVMEELAAPMPNTAGVQVKDEEHTPSDRSSGIQAKQSDALTGPLV